MRLQSEEVAMATSSLFTSSSPSFPSLLPLLSPPLSPPLLSLLSLLPLLSPPLSPLPPLPPLPSLHTSLSQEKARQNVQSAIANCRMKGCPSVHSEHVVRVNDTESGLLPLDLEAVFKSCDPASWSHDLSHDPRGVMPDALLLPKVETTEQLQEVRISLINLLII